MKIRLALILTILVSGMVGVAQNSINNGGAIVGASAVAAHKVYGNNTGSTAAAAFVQLACADLSDSGSGCTGSGGGGGTGSSVVNKTAVTVSANTTADQTLQELALSAGYLNTSSASFRLVGAGVETIGAAQTPTLEYKIKLCTVSGCGSGTVVTLSDITSGASVAATNDSWYYFVEIVTNTTGASGNLIVKGGITIDIGATPGTLGSTYLEGNTTNSGNIDLTAALYVDFTVATSVGSTTNSFKQMIAKMDPQVGATVSSVFGLTGAVMSGAIPADDGVLVGDSASTATWRALPNNQALKYTTSTNTFSQASASTLSDGITGTGSIVMSASPTLTGTLAAASQTLSGKITSYNGVTTAGWGIPIIVASGRLTALTAASGTVATFTPGADASFEVSAQVLVTASTTYSFKVDLTYTDEGNTSRTVDMAFQVSQSGVANVTTLSNGAGGAGAYNGMVFHIRAKSGTAITIATNAGTFTTVTYNIEAIIRQIS